MRNRMDEQGQERWGSRAGFVLATAGSAVGLGNIWGFPSVTHGHLRAGGRSPPGGGERCASGFG